MPVGAAVAVGAVVGASVGDAVAVGPLSEQSSFCQHWSVLPTRVQGYPRQQRKQNQIIKSVLCLLQSTISFAILSYATSSLFGV